MVTQIFYYVSGNTSKGFINFVTSNLENIENIIVLDHPSAQLKTNIFNLLIKKMNSDDSAEVIKSTIGRDHNDGLIVRNKSLAILSNFISEPVKERAKWIDLTSIVPPVNEEKSQNEMMQIRKHMNKAYVLLEQALKTHDQLENIYIKEMDFNRADQIIESFIDELLFKQGKTGQQSYTIRRFFGTTTAEGPINVINEIIQPIKHRTFIKGRAGTGKSVFMRRVAKACQNRGYPIIVYHCSFDPDSIDMVHVPALDFCIFDSTSPHEMFPDRESDVVIDLYKETVTEGTDEKYEKEIKLVTQTYKSYLKKGIEQIKLADTYRSKLETYYPTITSHSLENIADEVLKQIE